MSKESWVFKNDNESGLEEFHRVLKEMQPQLKEDWDKFMNEEVPAFNKLFQSSRQ